jgi:hypothetical protein
MVMCGKFRRKTSKLLLSPPAMAGIGVLENSEHIALHTREDTTTKTSNDMNKILLYVNEKQVRHDGTCTI